MARDLTWSQGGLLTVEDHGNTELPPLNADEFWMVISHDCDLANENEPFVEIIKTLKVDSPNSGYRNLKNPRTLEITLRGDAANLLHLRLEQNSKLHISRDKFNTIFSHLAPWKLGDSEFSVLKQWLGMRYNRPAFPENFEARFRTQVNKKSTLKKEFDAILAEYSEDVLVVFFDLGEARRKELKEDEIYDLRIVLVYAYDHKLSDKPSARHAEAKNAIEKIFHAAFGKLDRGLICLESCKCLSDAEVTLLQLRQWDSWHTDAISSRKNQDVALVTSGAIAP